MRGVRAGQGGAVAGELVGNPAAAGHRVKSSRADGDGHGSVDAAEEAVLAGQRFLVKQTAVEHELQRRNRADQHGHDQPTLLTHRARTQNGMAHSERPR